MTRKNARKFMALLLTGGLLAGTLICFICDTALNGALSWSRIVALSCAYGWALLFPLAAFGRRGLTGGLGALSLLTVPYLYGLSCLLGIREVFTLGAAMAVISLPFLWLICAAFRRLGRTSRALGTMCLLLAGLTAAVNGALTLLGAAPPPDAWDGLNVLLLLLAAAVCFTWRRSRESAST